MKELEASSFFCALVILFADVSVGWCTVCWCFSALRFWLLVFFVCWCFLGLMFRFASVFCVLVFLWGDVFLCWCFLGWCLFLCAGVSVCWCWCLFVYLSFSLSLSVLYLCIYLCLICLLIYVSISVFVGFGAQSVVIGAKNCANPPGFCELHMLGHSGVHFLHNFTKLAGCPAWTFGTSQLPKWSTISSLNDCNLRMCLAPQRLANCVLHFPHGPWTSDPPLHQAYLLTIPYHKNIKKTRHVA